MKISHQKKGHYLLKSSNCEKKIQTDISLDNEDKKLIRLALQIDGSLLEAFAYFIQKNPKYIKLAIKKNPFILYNLSSDTLKSVFSSFNNELIRHCGETLISNVIITKDIDIFMKCSYDIKNNNKIVYNIVKECGIMLSHASEGLKDNLDIVKRAILKNPEAIASASTRIQNDPLITTLFNNMLSKTYFQTDYNCSKKNNPLQMVHSKNSLASI